MLRILHPVLGPSMQEGHQWSSWSGAGVLWGEAEGRGLAQPGEGMDSGTRQQPAIACEEIMEEMEPGPSCWCMAGGREATGVS